MSEASSTASGSGEGGAQFLATGGGSVASAAGGEGKAVAGTAVRVAAAGLGEAVRVPAADVPVARGRGVGDGDVPAGVPVRRVAVGEDAPARGDAGVPAGRTVGLAADVVGVTCPAGRTTAVAVGSSSSPSGPHAAIRAAVITKPPSRVNHQRVLRRAAVAGENGG